MHVDIGDIAAVFALIAGAIVVGGMAQRLRVSAPILLVLAGLAVSFIPGVPDYTLNPDVVLYFFLPPLLYSAAWRSSFRGFRQNIRSIGLLSVGLVLATTAAVGFAAAALIPGLPLAAAFALGAVVAPPDAVAATAVGRQLGLPRRLLTILQGESLVNDATALTAYRVAIVAAAAGGVTLAEASRTFLLAAGGGVAIGAVLAFGLHWVRTRVIQQPVLESAIGLLTPFVVYLLAESIYASGVLAVVVTGLYLGHTASATSFSVRLQGYATWEVIDFVLESLVFALIGLQLAAVVRGLEGRSVGDVVWWSVAILLVVIVVRFVWVYSTAYLPLKMFRRRSDREPPDWREPFVISWAGMRGVVSLAAAFLLASDFPSRDLILFLTLVVVFGTLVLQGLTLPWVIRRLNVVGREDYADRLAEANAQHQAARAAVDRLDQLVAESAQPPPDEVVEKLQLYAENRSHGAWERLGGPTGMEGGETPSAAFRRLRQEMVRAEREVFVRLRDEGDLDDEVLREVIHELDLEEAMLSRSDDR